jgi:hypothetical protein
MNTTTDNRIDEVSVAYKPANTCDSVNGWLYYVLVAISLAALFSDSIKSANWKGQGELTIVFLKVSFLVLTLAMFSLFLVSKFLLIPSAERVRRKQLLADALGATITPEITVRYYNNGFPASIQRLAANVMENSLFSKEVAKCMLPTVRAKTFAYLVVWLIVLAVRQSSLDLVLWISQLVFSLDIIAYWLTLELLRHGHARVYDDLYQHFLHNHGEENAESKATVLDLFATYEATKAVNGVLLDSKVFFRENDRLSKKWDDLRSKLMIP